MYIERVKISNFRSIAEDDIHLRRYSALVGMNDSGKSNFLRALNLFFNGQTDIGSLLDFSKDYSQQAKVLKGKARQILIEIEFIPPSNYADNDPIIWRKVYRENSPLPFSEELFKKNRMEFSRGSKTEFWVRNLNFEYVPAIRGQSFFTILKRRLYTTLAATVAKNLTSASGAFLSNIRTELKNIENESKRLLALQTEFSLPNDLGELFEILDFDATDADSKTALQNRGDGIQGRHVSVILKFLADQRKINASRGKPPGETIWGFEEPENNLELKKQIEVASEFNEYTSSIQILVSTHSPAFYGAALLDDGVRIATRQAGKTTFHKSLPAESIDEHLGLMPFIQPYLKKAVAERETLLSTIKTLKDGALMRNNAALYLEGHTDQRILEAAFEAKGIKRSFELVTKSGNGAGANWVVGCCVARAAMTDIREKTAALLDSDSAGSNAAAKIESHCESIGRPKPKVFKVANPNGDDEIRRIMRKGINIPFGIEELCGATAWEHAEANGWLIERDTLLAENVQLMKGAKDKSFTDVLNDLLGDESLHLRRLVEYKVSFTAKTSFSKLVAGLYKEEPAKVTPSMEALVKRISDYFSPEGA
ncbi:ATP-dependent nuclease [Variovorax sp. tm]|uniref:ATP-dependent nuclease n=1 Tax=Variovorax atrisoli TaxID=3394203 RepID=UPI003A805FF4